MVPPTPNGGSPHGRHPARATVTWQGNRCPESTCPRSDRHILLGIREEGTAQAPTVRSLRSQGATTLQVHVGPPTAEWLPCGVRVPSTTVGDPPCKARTPGKGKKGWRSNPIRGTIQKREREGGCERGASEDKGTSRSIVRDRQGRLHINRPELRGKGGRK